MLILSLVAERLDIPMIWSGAVPLMAISVWLTAHGITVAAIRHSSTLSLMAFGR